MFGGELKYSKEMQKRMVTNETWVFSIKSKSWNKLLNKDFIESRRNHSATVIG